MQLLCYLDGDEYGSNQQSGSEGIMDGSDIEGDNSSNGTFDNTGVENVSY
jgi:hypothetical protein